MDQTRRIDLENSCWDELSALGLAEAPELFEEYLWGEFGRLGGHSGAGRDERLITIVALLLRRSTPGTWTSLKGLIILEPSIGQAAIVRAADISQENAWLEHLNDDEIADFYIWMSRQFPADIGQIQGAGFVGDEIKIRMLRESALVNLRSRGNFKVFRSVLRALPDIAWLPMQLAYVEEAHFRHRWRVETPEGLLLMAAENSVPWYLKKQSLVILLIVGFLIWPSRSLVS